MIAAGVGVVVGYFVGVRARAREVEAAALAMHAASLAAQASAIEAAAAALVVAERERYDARLRILIAQVADLVQDDLANNTHGGRAVAAQQALYQAQEAHHGR